MHWSVLLPLAQPESGLWSWPFDQSITVVVNYMSFSSSGREVAQLPAGKDDDPWVILGRFAIEHVDEGDIPEEDYGNFIADWVGQCGVCSTLVVTPVSLPVDPKWVGWCKPGDGGEGRTWCRCCGAAVGSRLVRVRRIGGTLANL